MIFKLLDAYEEEIKSEYSFLNKIKRMSVVNKVCLGILCVVFVILLSSFFWKSNLTVRYVVDIICGIVALLAINYSERQEKKNYIKNVIRYNERLTKLRIVLEGEEFNINSKSKLLNLIEKINKYVDNENKKNNERIQGERQFYSNVIIPILAFAFGYWYSDKPVDVTLQECTVLVVIIIFIRYICCEMLKLKEAMMESIETKLSYLSNELKDLYDRDYIE